MHPILECYSTVCQFCLTKEMSNVLNPHKEQIEPFKRNFSSILCRINTLSHSRYLTYPEKAQM